MAIFKSSTNGKLANGIKYADKDRRAENDFSLCRGVNCSDFAEIALKQMRDTKAIFDKKGGREYQHYILSFAPGEITKEAAIEYAAEHAQRCFGERFQVFVGLHTNSESGVLHAHYIVNSVSHIDGRKIQTSKEDYEIFKNKNDDLAREYGLQIIDRSPEAVEERGRKQLYSMAAYQQQKKAEKQKDGKISFAFDCYRQVKACLNQNPRSFVEFADWMKEQGWEAKLRGKNITFQFLKNPKCKVRANTLAKKYNCDSISTAGILYCCFEDNWQQYLKQPKPLQREKQIEKIQVKPKTAAVTSGLDTLRRLSQQHGQQQPKSNKMKPNLRRRERERERDDYLGF